MGLFVFCVIYDMFKILETFRFADYNLVGCCMSLLACFFSL